MQEDAEVEWTEHLPKIRCVGAPGDAIDLEDFVVGSDAPSVSFKGLSRSSSPRPL